MEDSGYKWRENENSQDIMHFYFFVHATAITK